MLDYGGINNNSIKSFDKRPLNYLGNRIVKRRNGSKNKLPLHLKRENRPRS